MSRYLQRLVNRAVGDARERPLAPFIRAVRHGIEGGEADPFERVAGPPATVAAPPPGPPETGLSPRPTDRARAAESPAVETVHRTQAREPEPTRPMGPTSLSAKGGRPGAPEPEVSPVAGARRSPDRDALPQDGLAHLPSRPRVVRSASDSSSPAPVAQAAVPVEGAPRAGTPAEEGERPALPTVRRPEEPLRLARRRPPEESRRPPAEPPPSAPPAEREREAAASAPELRPPAPAPPAATRATAEQPRVVIGHLSIEVLPDLRPAPQPVPVRTVQRVAEPADRSEPAGSKLRFGLGQM